MLLIRIAISGKLSLNFVRKKKNTAISELTLGSLLELDVIQFIVHEANIGQKTFRLRIKCM